MTAEEKYIAGAYLVVFMAVLVYVLIIALKLARLEQALHELEASAASSPPENVKAPPQAPLPLAAQPRTQPAAPPIVRSGSGRSR